MVHCLHLTEKETEVWYQSLSPVCTAAHLAVSLTPDLMCLSQRHMCSAIPLSFGPTVGLGHIFPLIAQLRGYMATEDLAHVPLRTQPYKSSISWALAGIMAPWLIPMR